MRFDRRPLAEFLGDDIPEDGNPRWAREIREVNMKRLAKGYKIL